ncbi:hypothetical protein RI367_006497 [Sorochytrium milnesiophthora]
MTATRVFALCLALALCLVSQARANAVNIYQEAHDDGVRSTAEFYDNQGWSVGKTNWVGNGEQCAGDYCVANIPDLRDCDRGGETGDVRQKQVDVWFHGQYQRMSLRHQWYCNDNNLYMQFQLVSFNDREPEQEPPVSIVFEVVQVVLILCKVTGKLNTASWTVTFTPTYIKITMMYIEILVYLCRAIAVVYGLYALLTTTFALTVFKLDHPDSRLTLTHCMIPAWVCAACIPLLAFLMTTALPTIKGQELVPMRSILSRRPACWAKSEAA